VTLLNAFFTVLVPFLIGLLLGFATGLITGISSAFRWFDRRRQQGKTMPSYSDDANPTPGRRPFFGNEHLSRYGVLLAIMGTLAIAASIVSLVNDRNISDCLADYAQSSATASKALVEAGDIDRQADREARAAIQDSVDALASILDIPPQQDAEARQKIVAEYKTRFARNRDRLAAVEVQKARAAEIRVANPLPPPPAC
jgi:hypothetical protein